jgi:hypothetical protein
MSGGGGSSVAGFKYFFGIHAGIGRGPMDELVEIRVGTKLAAQPQMTASGDGVINVPNLFGGEKKEGGIDGPYRLMMGEPTQTMPARLAEMIAPAPATGFRRMVTFFYEGLVSALNPYPKEWAFRMRRALQGWDGEVFRPDLAIIPLLGPEAADGEGSYGPETDGVINVVGLNSNPITATYVPPAGRRITSVTHAHIQNPAEALDLTPVPILGVTPNPDGSATVSFGAEHYMKVIFADVIHEPMDGGATSLSWISAETLGVPKPIRIHVRPASGETITSMIDIHRSVWDDGNLIITTIPMLNVALQSDGSALVDVPPSAWGSVGYVGSYNHAGGVHPGVPIEQSDFINPWPAVFPLVPPENGVVTSVISVERVVTDPNASPGGDGGGPGPQFFPVAFTFDDETDTLSTYDSRIGGANLTIKIKYRPNLNPDGNFTPIRAIHAMNPAHIIYETLTNREWGRGLDRSLLNTLSFESCAEVLKAEGFGMCIRWSRRDSIDAFIQEVLDTVGATLFMDRTTALMTMRLIRKDYDTSTLKLWDVTNGILTIESSNVNTSAVVINEVIVKYREPVYNEDRAVNVQNLASLQSGSFKTMTKTYKGIPTSELARRVAQRDLRANAEGLRRYTLTMDRRGSHITPGHVMKIQDVSRSIFPTVVRVATVKSGPPDAGQITVSVVQDVFAFPERTFVSEQPAQWSRPNFTPCIGQHRVFEVPYFLLARTMSPADFDYLTDTSAYIGVVAERARSSNMGYDIAVRVGAPTPDDIPTTSAAMYCGYTS